MGQAKQRKVEIDALKAGTTLFDYLSSDETSERDATWTVIQLFSLQPILENFGNCYDRNGYQLSKEYLNDVFKGLRKDHNIEYVPTKQINDDLILMSHVDISSYKDSIEPLVDSWCKATVNNMKAKEKLRQQVVMIDPELAGTKDHKKGIFHAVFFYFGEYKIIAAHRAGKTVLTLSLIDQGRMVKTPLELLQTVGEA